MIKKCPDSADYWDISVLFVSGQTLSPVTGTNKRVLFDETERNNPAFLRKLIRGRRIDLEAWVSKIWVVIVVLLHSNTPFKNTVFEDSICKTEVFIKGKNY